MLVAAASYGGIQRARREPVDGSTGRQSCRWFHSDDLAVIRARREIIRTPPPRAVNGQRPSWNSAWATSVRVTSPAAKRSRV